MSKERLAAFVTILVFILAAVGAAYACYMLIPRLLADKTTSPATIILLLAGAALVVVPVVLKMLAGRGAK
ncbi:MAG TPA: hypothetical protein VIG62_12910 [Blastocatellia bacterium]|jgi:hypothetical protein